MNKQKAKQELSQLQSEFTSYTDDFKKRTEELERIINGSGFDWDFINGKYACFGDGQIENGYGSYINDYRLVNSFTTNSEKYAKQLAKVQALNALLMQLAEHFNPEGWEPDLDNGDEPKCSMEFNNIYKKVAVDISFFYVKPTIYFHKDVIEYVIEELESNREKWVHLVGWEK